MLKHDMAPKNAFVSNVGDVQQAHYRFTFELLIQQTLAHHRWGDPGKNICLPF